MKKDVIIKTFTNIKGEERYLIEDCEGNVLHNAGGAGFKTVDTAERFANSHLWIIVSKPSLPEAPALF